jgi:glutathione synthase/RimK-type ligase-like ATP-grasp enzyme
MILVVSHGGDGHLPLVQAQLDAAGAQWMLLDTDDYPQKIAIDDGPAGCVLRWSSATVALTDVSAVWWRRPRPPVIPGRRGDVAAWSERQAFVALDSALLGIDALWVNHPHANRRAENKPANLRRAVVFGLDVPPWRVTNDPDAARAFVAEQDEIVVKPVDSAYVNTATSMWTRRLDDIAWLDRLGPEPYLFQGFVRKVDDVRVTIVGEHVHAVAIDSQSTTRTSVDMRAGNLRDLAHRAIELPAEIRERLLALSRSLDLQFAAIDLIRDRDDRMWFLEVNPNGQWAWLEQMANVPIAAELAELLTTA